MCVGDVDDGAAVEEEGAGVLAMTAPGADHDIRFGVGAVSGS
jgi:hypothetical protein